MLLQHRHRELYEIGQLLAQRELKGALPSIARGGQTQSYLSLLARQFSLQVKEDGQFGKLHNRLRGTDLYDTVGEWVGLNPFLVVREGFRSITPHLNFPISPGQFRHPIVDALVRSLPPE